MRPVVALCVALSLPAAAAAQEPIRFARTPDISPDGKTVAFSYLGDIWTVPSVGGVARPVTMHEAHDVNPVFSPDGKWIAFSSNRHGSYDVFVSPAVGGRPRRLTFDSGHDTVTGWTPDGKGVVFTSTRSTAYPFNSECYVVPFDGGAERKLALFEGKEAHFAPTGDRLAFVRGPGLWYRRGYRGSSNDEIWLANADGGSPRRFTTFDGQDGSPMWSPDGRTLLYVSEEGSPRGCANIVSRPADSTSGTPTRLTTHGDDTVRRARISGNGEWVVYELGADLWVVSTRGGPPRRLAIEVNADDKANTERAVTYTRDATEFALSPDEEHAVVCVHGELFLTRLPDGNRATRLTDHPAYDHSAVFSPDGKSILFASDRSGVEDLYLLEPDDAEHPELTKAHTFKVKQLTRTPEAESGARFSPKGDRVAFLRSGKLWTMKPDGTDQKVMIDTPQVFDFEYSPDGKHVVFARMDGSFASEVYIAPTDGSEPPRNVTRYATYNGDVSWSSTGGKVAFIGQRRGTYVPHVLSLQKPAAPGAPKAAAGEIDWDDIHLRGEKAAGIAADTVTISPNGTQVAFRHSGAGNGDDLWVAAAGGGSLNRVTTGNLAPRQIRWSKKNTGQIYFLTGTGELRQVRLPGLFAPATNAAEPPKVNFQARMVVRRDEEFAEMFAQSWRGLSDYFYDPAHHGADWTAVRTKYLALVPHVAMKEDLYALVSLMLGELNASHLGISGVLPTAQEPTADLGLLFDPSYRGPGLKVAEVLKRGPADKRGLGIKPGDVVVAIDRAELTGKVNVSQLLNNKAGEGVLLDVASDPADKKTRRRVEVFPIARDKASELMYDRWVDANAAAVAKQSGGKIGYIHIPGMDEPGLEKFMRALYSDNFDKDAIIVDVRYNGGGYTHDQVLNYLSGKEHTFFRQRDGGEGLVLRNYDRKFTRPVAVMTNNRSYSDAEIFPHAFRTLGLGKVVGQATGGFVIGTTSTRLIDGSTLRLPRTGVYTVKGVNMEKEGVVPDVAVEQDPADFAKGIDTQLARAVSVLADDVAAWRRTRGLPTGTAPAAVPTMPVAPMPRTAPAAPTPAIPPAADHQFPNPLSRMPPVVLAIDQGTTSSRAVVYDPATFAPLGVAQQEIGQHYPRDGWVEHEPEDIWYSVARTCREALAAAGRSPKDVAAVGITNQRETVVVWDRATGRPVHRAIVWQDRRTTDFCRAHAADGAWLTGKTGLVLDPYFSGTKLRWLLENVPNLRPAAERGELAAGTIDTFLMWRLTGGAAHVTDATNASRTLLFDIQRMAWDDELLNYFGVPRAVLPEVKPSAADFGVTRGLDFLPDGVPIRGVAGDQQAALFGQGCFGPGEAKCTYGTGAFLLLHTGGEAVASKHRLLTTAAASTDGSPKYALEGAVFVAGAAVQWLRDGLRLFATAAESEELAGRSNPDEPVVFVPGLVGLGAPHWVPEARGVIFGLTRATTAADLARAALEGVAFQVADLIDAAVNDLGVPPGGQTPLKVDGGMARNDRFLRTQADFLGRPVVRAAEAESTALGAGMLAAVGAGLTDEAALTARAAAGTRFDPQLPAAARAARRAAWQRAVKAVVAFYTS